MLASETFSRETYMGETYLLQRREIQTFSNARGYRVVWCWEVMSGPTQGHYGGKCATKDEARKWARFTIREVGKEVQ